MMQTSTDSEDAEPIVLSSTTSQASLESLDAIRRSVAADNDDDDDDELSAHDRKASVCCFLIHSSSYCNRVDSLCF